jgi:hypothetical protein
MKCRTTFMTAAAFMTAFGGSQAQAATWVKVGSSDIAAIYIDTASVSGSRRGAIAWEKWVYKPAAKREYAEVQVRKRYDCNAHTSRLLASVKYGETGSVLNSFAFSDNESAAITARQSSVGKSILDAVCARVSTIR